MCLIELYLLGAPAVQVPAINHNRNHAVDEVTGPPAGFVIHILHHSAPQSHLIELSSSQNHKLIILSSLPSFATYRVPFDLLLLHVVRLSGPVVGQRHIVRDHNIVEENLVGH